MHPLGIITSSLLPPYMTNINKRPINVIEMALRWCGCLPKSSVPVRDYSSIQGKQSDICSCKSVGGKQAFIWAHTHYYPAFRSQEMLADITINTDIMLFIHYWLSVDSRNTVKKKMKCICSWLFLHKRQHEIHTNSNVVLLSHQKVYGKIKTVYITEWKQL